jgi:hypothetical protein
VALVRTYVSEKFIASITREKRIDELGTPLELLVTSNLVPSSLLLSTLIMEAIRSSESPFLQEPHGVTSQKAAFFIVTAMRTSNLT